MMNGRGLSAYLRQKSESMRSAAAARPRGLEWYERVEAISSADDVTGVRKLRIGEWQLISDSGPAFGGWRLGPSSPELLCGVISTCITHTYLIHAASQQVPLDRVTVRVSCDNNDARFLGIDTDDPAVPFNLSAVVEIQAPEATPEQLSELHAYVDEHCPLTQIVRGPHTLTLTTSAG